jgi:hypothetical protein
MDALEAIAALQQAIQENRIGEETTWTLYEKIEYALDFDPRSTAEEKQSVVHLGEAMRGGSANLDSGISGVSA